MKGKHTLKKLPAFIFDFEHYFLFIMTLTQLNYIIAVDNYRHFADAAQKCYVTQPTLSMQIHKLEQELGVQIFDRSKHPVIPTKIGEKIIGQARLTLKDSDRIKELISEGQNEFTGTFRVGVIPSVAPYLLPYFLKNFTRKYPKINLKIEEALTDTIVYKVNHDKLDAGILAQSIKEKNIFELPLFNEPFIVYVSAKNQLSRKSDITINDLDGHHVWLLRKGHCLRDQVLHILDKKKILTDNETVQFESGNIESLKNLVEQNFGLTLLPKLAIRGSKQNSQAKVCNFKSPVPERSVKLVYGRLFLKKNIIDAFKKEIIASIPKEFLNGRNSILIA
ncbi:MAG TPA: LysR substrate-binding domain-containing protein [Balneolales bacterium]|nr:LysR substrate-binding domain-containing protein [Balneolales bacterium]